MCGDFQLQWKNIAIEEVCLKSTLRYILLYQKIGGLMISTEY